MLGERLRWVVLVSWPGGEGKEALPVASWWQAHALATQAQELGFTTECHPTAGISPRQWLDEARQRGVSGEAGECFPG